MFLRIIFLLILNLVFIYSCTNESGKSNDLNNSESIIDNGKPHLSDSATSSIKLESSSSNDFMQAANITNVIYSMESFYFKDSLKYFICKAKIDEKGTLANVAGIRNEKYEFYDYNFIKQFEINSRSRKIELQSKYFITHGLFSDFPRIFELNNYETNKAFVKCTGICWTAEIPNGETTAYFGYQSKPHSNEGQLNQLGSFYFGLNEELIKEIRFFYEPNQRYHGLVSFSLITKNEKDKISYSSSEIKKLLLWTKNGKSGGEFISGFDILLKLKREVQHKSNNYESIEYIITVKDGNLIGNGLKQTSYGYELILL